MYLVKCFPPIIDSSCHTLILGTVPGQTSLELEEYYGSPNNYFWDIIYRVFKPEWNKFSFVDKDIPYYEKKALLLENGIGLWDVISTCERKGSSDKDIKNEVLNDFDVFLTEHTGIRRILFNGIGSYKTSGYHLFDKYYQYLKANLEIKKLNSTSPQNPNNPFMILNQWHKALRK